MGFEGNTYFKGQDVPHLHRTVLVKKRSSRPWNVLKNNPGIWVPAVPSWEKDFCKKVGFFAWENFVEAKKHTRYNYKILNWNDSAAEKAFHNAKNRFYARINGLPESNDESSMSINDPDLYIDEIDWDDEVCPELLDESDWAKLDSDDDEDGQVKNSIKKLDMNVQNYNIKPTGWDVDDLQDLSRGRVLTGICIGY